MTHEEIVGAWIAVLPVVGVARVVLRRRTWAWRSATTSATRSSGLEPERLPLGPDAAHGVCHRLHSSVIPFGR